MSGVVIADPLAGLVLVHGLAGPLDPVEMKVDDDGHPQVDIVATALPTGAATQATLELCRLLLVSLDGKDFATQTTLAAILAQVQLIEDLRGALGSVGTDVLEVQVTESELPDGASTEVTVAEVSSRLGDEITPAAGTVNAQLAALLTELEGKADLAETQPVSAASLPLPSGAATESTLAALAALDFATQTTLAALLTELQGKADLAETQPVSAAGDKLFGFNDIVHERTVDSSLDAGTNNVTIVHGDTGYIWVVTNIAFQYDGGVPTSVTVFHRHDSNYYELWGQLAPADGQLYDRQGFWVLEDGDALRATIAGCGDEDGARITATGYRMTAPS